MTPSQHFAKKIIGQLVTRQIDNISLDGMPASIKDEKQYDIIDVIKQGPHKLFVVNEWVTEGEKRVLAIHNNFVKEVKFL